MLSCCCVQIQMSWLERTPKKCLLLSITNAVKDRGKVLVSLVLSKAGLEPLSHFLQRREAWQ